MIRMETRTLDAMVVLLGSVPSQLLTRVMTGPAPVASHTIKPHPLPCITKWMRQWVECPNITTDVIRDVRQEPAMQTSKTVMQQLGPQTQLPGATMLMATDMRMVVVVHALLRTMAFSRNHVLSWHCVI